MNDAIVNLYNDYLRLVGDPGGAASLTLADTLAKSEATIEDACQSYTVKEAARRLSLSSKKVYLMCIAGQLHCFRAGRAIRISTEEIERFEADQPAPPLRIGENRHASSNAHAGGPPH